MIVAKFSGLACQALSHGLQFLVPATNIRALATGELLTNAWRSRGRRDLSVLSRL